MDGVEKNVAREYPASLMRSLCTLWQEDCFCDVRLQVAQQQFQAHRLVLAAASPYFKAMFTSGMTEGKLDCITLHDVRAAIFEKLIRFMYTDEAQVNGETSQEVTGILYPFTAKKNEYGPNARDLEIFMSSLISYLCLLSSSLMSMFLGPLGLFVIK